MRYIVRVASYDKDRKRASVFNMPARDYKDAQDIHDAMTHTESRNAVVCIRLFTQAGPVLLNIDELQGFADELGEAINETQSDSRYKKAG